MWPIAHNVQVIQRLRLIRTGASIRLEQAEVDLSYPLELHVKISMMDPVPMRKENANNKLERIKAHNADVLISV